VLEAAFGFADEPHALPSKTTTSVEIAMSAE
jgi:hypothetical protein